MEQTELTELDVGKLKGQNGQKLYMCELCDQRFTNKLKMAMHFCTNHDFFLCSLCNIVFKNDEDRQSHEKAHFPFSCTCCSFLFEEFDGLKMKDHYLKSHKAYLCEYCSTVIEPVDKMFDHIAGKHMIENYTIFQQQPKLYELEKNSIFFQCNMCNKKKNVNIFYGHYIYYHNLSIHVLREYISLASKIQIDGAQLMETRDKIEATKDQDICEVCDNDCSTNKDMHFVFCKGFVCCAECLQVFEDQKSLTQHAMQSHGTSNCKFGCQNTSLYKKDITEHNLNFHDIMECHFCDFINSSNNSSKHMKEKHNVDLLKYQPDTDNCSKLYRVENTNQSRVLCNFCSSDITSNIREFSFINHYTDEHKINTKAILKNLNKNPIIDAILKSNKDDDYLKNFTVSASMTNQSNAVVDFNTNLVFCIRLDNPTEHKIFNETKDGFDCDFCKKKFDQICFLYQHLSDSHGFKLLNVNQCITCNFNVEDNQDNKDFNLSIICPSHPSLGKFITKDDFINHMNTHDEYLNTSLSEKKIIYKCSCDLVYENLTSIRSHMKEDHPNEKILFCKVCRIPLNESNNCEHSLENKAIEKFNCNGCPKSYSRKKLAIEHYLNVHKNKPSKKANFKCTLCNTAFSKKEDRQLHFMWKHPDEKMFKCKFIDCGREFSTKSSLSSHNMIHKNIVHVCKYCKKEFNRRDSFKEHLLIHEGPRHKCNFCNKNFVQRSNLIRHERIHLNLKPYTCSHCDKSFSDKGACTSHEKIHTKTEYSTCNYCGKSFARKQKLKYHMRIHTLQGIFTCDVCGKIFVESYALRKHKETHLKSGRSDRCELCSVLFKSIKAKQNHMEMFHASMENEMIETVVQCTLCNSKDMSADRIKDHLFQYHGVDETTDWKQFISEVEFEIEIVPDQPTTSKKAVK